MLSARDIVVDIGRLIYSSLLMSRNATDQAPGVFLPCRSFYMTMQLLVFIHDVTCRTIIVTMSQCQWAEILNGYHMHTCRFPSLPPLESYCAREGAVFPEPDAPPDEIPTGKKSNTGRGTPTANIYNMHICSRNILMIITCTYTYS